MQAEYTIQILRILPPNALALCMAATKEGIKLRSGVYSPQFCTSTFALAQISYGFSLQCFGKRYNNVVDACFLRLLGAVDTCLSSVCQSI